MFIPVFPDVSHFPASPRAPCLLLFVFERVGLSSSLSWFPPLILHTCHLSAHQPCSTSAPAFHTSSVRSSFSSHDGGEASLISDLFFVFNSLTQIPVGPYTLGDVEGLLIKAEGINTPASFGTPLPSSDRNENICHDGYSN